MKKNILLFVIFSFLIFIIYILFFYESMKLPRIYLEGSLDKLVSKDDEENFYVKYESSDLSFNSYARIKLQGKSSLSFDKKNYNIKFYNDSLKKEKKNIDFGWGDNNKYCIKANWIDKTHSRNIVTANIFADMQKDFNLFVDTPNYGVIDGYPVEIYLNDSFLGLYTLNIAKDEFMFNMDKSNKNHLVFASKNWTKSTAFLEVGDFDSWEMEVGEETEENLNKLNRVIDFVISSSDYNFKKNINNYFNLDSLLNYYIMLQFANLIDNTANNLLLVTYDGLVWYTTLYDMDSSFGTYMNGTLVDYSSVDFPSLGSNLWNRLETNFSNELTERYFYFRKTILTKKNVMKKFRSFYNLISEDTLNKEIDKWGDIPGYDLEQIETFLDYKIPILDDFFRNLSS